MAGNISNRPRILHGAFVELGRSVPPLFVVFQFNPEELSRSRSLSFRPPNHTPPSSPAGSKHPQAPKNARKDLYRDLRDYHRKEADLLKIQEKQTVAVSEESLRFDIRLDATDKLNAGDPIAGHFGIAPQLSTLELMVLPKDESLLGEAAAKILARRGKGFSLSKSSNPPIVLFIFGRSRVLPVNVNSLSIRETEFNTDLAPVRAIVSVDLTVIEGANGAYRYTKVLTEGKSALNLANVADVANVVIPA